MAATGRILGALLLTILGVSSISAQCDWVTYNNRCTFGGTLYGGISNDYECRRVCSNLSPRCKGYSWDPRGPQGPKCLVFYDQIDIPASQFCEDVTTHVNLCLTTYPPYPYPTTTSDYPGRPDSSCPTIEGLGPGLVALIGIFCAIGGAILGMLLVCCCCPAKGFGRPSSNSSGSGCKSSTHKEKPAFLQTQGPVVEAGQVYSVPKTSLNGEPYSVSISVR